MPGREEVAIAEIINRFGDSWNRHDVRALASLFAEDADFVDVFGNWFKSRDEIEKALTVRHATVFKDSRFTQKEVAIRVLKPGVAVVHAVFELSGAVDPKGRPLAPGLGVMTYLMDNVERSGWRIVAFQNTAVVPPSVARPP